MKFIGKTAVVTGASVGIGRAAAIRFAKEGANVAALDINEETLAVLKEELAEFGSRVLTLTCNVADESSVKETFAGAGKADTAAFDHGAGRFGGDQFSSNAVQHIGYTPLLNWRRL